MNAGFLMDRNPIGAGIGEGGNVLVGILDHQVAVERNIHSLAQRRDHRRPDGNVGHKVTIHHIDMEQGGATSHRSVGILSQAGEIGRQNGRCYFNQNRLLSRRYFRDNFNMRCGLARMTSKWYEGGADRPGVRGKLWYVGRQPGL